VYKYLAKDSKTESNKTAYLYDCEHSNKQAVFISLSVCRFIAEQLASRSIRRHPWTAVQDKLRLVYCFVFRQQQNLFFQRCCSRSDQGHSVTIQWNVEFKMYL